jgi:hypothetical protein
MIGDDNGINLTMLVAIVSSSMAIENDLSEDR